MADERDLTYCCPHSDDDHEVVEGVKLCGLCICWRVEG